jgi:hypothetical protein
MPAGPEGIPAVYEVNGREYLAFSARPSLKHLGPGGERATVEASPDAPETQGFTRLPHLSRRISNVAVPWSLIDRLIVHC